MKRFCKVILITVIHFLLYSCKDSKNNSNISQTALDSGVAHVAVDESYGPLMQEMVEAFMNRYPKAKIYLHIRSEEECMKYLYNPKIDLIITSRTLTGEESDKLYARYNYRFRQDKLALDAIAVVVNKKNPDSIFTLDEIKKYLTQPYFKSKKIAVDGNRATASLNYIMDSILKSDRFPKHIKGVRGGSEKLLEAVSSDPNLIGFLGNNHIANPDDPNQLAWRKKITLAYIQSKKDPNMFIQPTAEHLYERRYPYIRQMNYILKTHSPHPAEGLVNFMQYEKGQLIIRRAYLVPLKMDFTIRPSKLTEKNLNEK